MRLALTVGTAVAASMIFTSPAPAQMPENGSTSFHIDFVKQGRAPVPFEMHNGILYFHMNIGGRDGQATWDNGMPGSVIDSSFASAAGLPEGRPYAPLNTATGSLPSRQIADVPLIIPGEIETRAPLRSVDLGMLSGKAGRKIDLILGHEMLSVLEMLVSSGSHRLMLGASGSLIPPSKFPLVPISQGRTIEVQIGEKTLSLELDLGLNADMALTPAAWSRVAPSGAHVAQHQMSNTEGKAFTVDAGQLPRVMLGATEATDVGVDISSHEKPGIDGRVGLGLLSRFDFILDLGAGKLWLAPSGAFHLG